MKFVMFLVDSTFMNATYSEIYEDNRVLLYKKLKNPILDKIRNIHTSIRINRYIKMPFQSIWNHTFFDEKKLLVDEECIFLFDEGNKQAYNKEYITYIKNKYKNAKICFLYWNPADYIDIKYINFVNKMYDLIISFDINDCKKYGWVHYSGIYSRTNNYEIEKNPKYDIFFVGNDKGRLKKLRELYKKFTDHGLKCCFYISDVDKGCILQDGIHYNEYLNYDDVVKYIQESKVLLEVLQDGQSGSTLRAMEALIYEKAFLTNNINIKAERYFDESQMYIFKDAKLIDIDRVVYLCQKYGTFKYSGNLSPKLFLDFLEKKLFQ